MSLKKLRHATEVQQRSIRTRSLKKLHTIVDKDHIKTSMADLNPQTNTKAQQSLAEYGITSQFLWNLFEKRCEENQMRTEEDKYRIFNKHFMSKMQRTFEVTQLRFKESSMTYFLKNIANNNHIVGLDLSNTRLSSIDSVVELIAKSNSICKLHLCNMTLQPKDFAQLFQVITESEKIIHLDLSNRVFQGANKLGEMYSALTKFIESNKILQILQLQGLNIRDKGLQALIDGLKGKQSNILSLNLKNNGFSRNGYSYIKQIIAHMNLEQLNLSDNRLGNYGIAQLQILKMRQISKLNLSNTDMQSQGLCNLLYIIKDSKSLTNLILDRNNFHHNWFKRIEDSVATNRSLKVLSLYSCNIKYIQSLFRALFDNHFVTKLDISGNNLGENIQSLVDLLKRNNSIRQLKLKQCGIQGSKSLDLYQVLTRNVTVRSMDLSDNNIGIEAGKQILKSVFNNETLISLNLDKTQIQLSVKMSIQDKLSKNKIQYQRNVRNQLKKQSTLLKNKDHAKNINIPVLLQQSSSNKQIIQKMRTQVEQLNSILSKKNEQKKLNLNNYECQIAGLNKILTKIQVDSKPKHKQLEYQKEQLDLKIKQLNAIKKQQMDIIYKLEKQLQFERDNIKTLENKLENKLDNQKYLNKKTNSTNKLPLIVLKHESPVKKVHKSAYKRIKNASKIDVLH